MPCRAGFIEKKKEEAWLGVEIIFQIVLSDNSSADLDFTISMKLGVSSLAFLLISLRFVLALPQNGGGLRSNPSTVRWKASFLE